MRHKFLTRHPFMTEEEFLSELDKIVHETLAESESHSEEFAYLNNLDEDKKIEIMKSWDRETWIRFRMQNTVSEQEVFDPIMKLIEEYDD